MEKTHYAELWVLDVNNTVFVTVVCRVKQPPRRFEVEMKLASESRPPRFVEDKVYCPYCGRLLQLSPVMDINVFDLSIEGEKR